jgi:Protein of unknown function (DUF1501)/Protein of unknown function (DUF1549)
MIPRIAALGVALGLAAAAPGPAAEVLRPASQRFADPGTREVPDFQRHVLPLMGRLGCNTRSCHGSFQGQGGFRLSLFGYDFKADHEALLMPDAGRVDVEAPEISKILQKPTLTIPHKGGRRLEPASWQYTMLRRWIEAGARGVTEPSHFEGLEVFPDEVVFQRPGRRIPLKVVAAWADGSREDVTCLARFQANDAAIAEVSPDGVVTSQGPGDTHVVAFYDNGVAPTQVLRPVSDRLGPDYPDVPTPTKVDALVVAKLRTLGIVPSEACSDSEFLRRASLDVTGTLPPPQEVEAFLDDPSPSKRAAKVDELLARPTYAAKWTTKLRDITGNSPRLFAGQPQNVALSRDWYIRRVGQRSAPHRRADLTHPPWRFGPVLEARSDVPMATNRYCDGIRRRDVLRLGVLGGAGLSLSGYLRLAEAGAVRPGRASAAIHVHLGGGPSHIDTFDMKPAAPAEIRGEFRPIATNVPGLEICEHLPLLARCADKFALLRGVSHNLAAHEFGTKYLQTGNRPLPSLAFPGYGAVVSKELGGPPDLPPFVAIPNTPQDPGYLGIEYAPFSTTAAPRPGVPFAVRGITLGPGLTIEDLERRRDLLTRLDRTFRGFEARSDLVNGLDRFAQRAYDIIRSPRCRRAFDISQESPGIAALFPATPFAQSSLLATRLVEAGVRFVSVSHGGWDTHQQNFERLKTRLLPDLDGALAGLFTALDQKGLLGSTAVFVSGEFGRTPRINPNAGRDHHPRAMFVLLGGGGITGGQVVGASDEKGMGPASGDGITPDDVAASFYHALGIDGRKEYRTTTGRPVAIVRYGTPIPALFA